MFDFYEKNIISNSKSESESNMPFRTFIDDICYKKTKKVNIFSCKREVKERSYTYTANDIPLENWRNRKSIESSFFNKNANCKNLQKKISTEYSNKKIKTNN